MTEMVMEGRVLAEKYELTRLLGQGGMGAVYEARNHLGKRFAVKLLLKPELLGDQGLIARFFREAKASAAIESEHIVEVYDTGVDPATTFPFIIMELLKGEDLEHTIGRVGALNPTAAARVIAQAAAGIGHAHDAGIVHRDIKPANIFMSMRGPADLVVKILDFGIAKQSVEALQEGAGGGLTKTGSMLGTPLYMSPEQARGLRTIDGRTDIWSLGMCLYEALSGRTPWGSVETLGDLILSICAREITPLQEAAPWVPAALAAVVHRALQREVSQRLQTATAFAEQLSQFCEGTSAITPAIITGVADAHRAAPSLTASGQRVATSSSSNLAPPAPSPFNASASSSGQVAKVTSAHVSSVAAVSSTKPGYTTGSYPEQTSEKKKTSLSLILGAAAAVVIVVGGGLAVMQAVGKHGNNASASGGGGEETAGQPASTTPAETATEPAKAKETATATAKKPDPAITATASSSAEAAPTTSAAPTTTAATTKVTVKPPGPAIKTTSVATKTTTTAATTAPTTQPTDSTVGGRKLPGSL